MIRSREFTEGMTASLVWLNDIIEKHQKGLVDKGYLRKIDIKFFLNLIDACIRRRELLSEVGADGVNLYISKSRNVSLKEK